MEPASRPRSGPGPQGGPDGCPYLQESTPTFFIRTVTEAEPPGGSRPKSTLEGTSRKPLGGTWGPLREVVRQRLLTGPSTDRNWRSHDMSLDLDRKDRKALGEASVSVASFSTFWLGSEWTLDMRTLAGSLTLVFLVSPVTSTKTDL